MKKFIGLFIFILSFTSFAQEKSMWVYKTLSKKKHKEVCSKYEKDVKEYESRRGIDGLQVSTETYFSKNKDISYHNPRFPGPSVIYTCVVKYTLNNPNLRLMDKQDSFRLKAINQSEALEKCEDYHIESVQEVFNIKIDETTTTEDTPTLVNHRYWITAPKNNTYLCESGIIYFEESSI